MALQGQIRGIVAALKQPATDPAELRRPKPVGPVEVSVWDNPAPTRERAAKRAVHRVLLADPNSVTRNVANCILINLGYEVDQVSDGLSALEAARHGGYDLVVLDVSLPEMNGYAVSRALRAAPETASVPVIALITGDAQQGRNDREEAGMNDYLSKPLRAPLVASVMARWDTGAAGAPPPSAIDTEMLASLKGIAGERAPLLLQELVELFQGTAPARIANARVAVQSGDYKTVAGEAHFLRGPASQLGANEMAQTCASIETMIRTSSYDHLGEAIERLARDFDGAIRGLTAYCREQAAARLRHELPAISKTTGPTAVPTSASSVAKPPKPAAPSGGNAVLVAEDDPLVARFVVTQLESAGYKVVVTGDGESALKILADKSFDLAILDINMPNIDGFGVLTQMKLKPETQAIPVLMLSSRGQSHDVVKAFDLGAEDYVTKPFNPLDLVARVRRLARARA